MKKKNALEAAFFTGLIVVVVAGVIFVATILESSFGLYRVNYSDCYGEFALTFWLGCYIPVKHMIAMIPFFISVVFISAYAAFRGMSIIEFPEYLAPLSGFAALAGLIFTAICVKIKPSLAALTVGNLKYFLSVSLGIFILSIIVGVVGEAVLARLNQRTNRS